jgi:DNA polymerase-3 subunit epsilon
MLRKLAGEHGLCLQRLGLESGRGPCFGYQLGRCRGVCAGQETEARHRLRLLQALSALRLAGWPFGGRIGIREHCPDSGRSEVHLVDHWCHLGTAGDADEWAELLATPHALGFDLDSYRLLRRYLEQHPEAEVIRAPEPASGFLCGAGDRTTP